MSIDCLLDRTIKHMLFLQSVTKHAERIKQIDEPKVIKVFLFTCFVYLKPLLLKLKNIFFPFQNNGVMQNKTYSNDPNNNGVTWACEVGNQTMICPLIVEDLSTPGQMLIEVKITRTYKSFVMFNYFVECLITLKIYFWCR